MFHVDSSKVLLSKEGYTKTKHPDDHNNNTDMAHVLENTKVVYGLRWAFNFIFGFKKIGPSCNAHRPKLFTDAECEAHPILCGEGQGGVSVGFVNLFETGFRIISQLKCGNLSYSDLEGHYKNAFEILNKFMDSRSEYKSNYFNNVMVKKNLHIIYPSY